VTLIGIDVSRHQGRIDWSAVAGVEFAICRASLATTPDPTFPRNRAGAAAIDLVPGAYHFLYPASVVSPERQADLFASLVGDPAGMLIALDIERDGDARPDSGDATRFISRLRSLWPAHPLLLYGPAWYWPAIGSPSLARYGPLWHSRYIGASGAHPRELYASVPGSFWRVSHGGWTAPTILQFTSRSRVSGIAGAVDGNAFRGTRAELLTLAGIAPLPAASEWRAALPRWPFWVYRVDAGRITGRSVAIRGAGSTVPVAPPAWHDWPGTGRRQLVRVTRGIYDGRYLPAEYAKEGSA